MATIVSLTGGPLAGRYDLSRLDIPPEILRIARAEPGTEVEGYRVQVASSLGSRYVVHARSVELVDRAVAAEVRERRQRRARRFLCG